jgi:hypothetical protein
MRTDANKYMLKTKTRGQIKRFSDMSIQFQDATLILMIFKDFDIMFTRLINF